jgi:hypothetical protein
MATILPATKIDGRLVQLFLCRSAPTPVVKIYLTASNLTTEKIDQLRFARISRQRYDDI